MYNRARGVALVSPDDLVRAAAQFAPLGLPLCARTFPSGVAVVQLAALDPRAAAATLAAAVAAAGHLSAAQLAHARGVSAVLALEDLLAAEALGLLCRDDTVEGLAFFPNRFRAGQ